MGEVGAPQDDVAAADGDPRRREALGAKRVELGVGERHPVRAATPRALGEALVVAVRAWPAEEARVLVLLVEVLRRLGRIARGHPRHARQPPERRDVAGVRGDGSVGAGRLVEQVDRARRVTEGHEATVPRACRHVHHFAIGGGTTNGLTSAESPTLLETLPQHRRGRAGRSCAPLDGLGVRRVDHLAAPGLEVRRSPPAAESTGSAGTAAAQHFAVGADVHSQGAEAGRGCLDGGDRRSPRLVAQVWRIYRIVDGCGSYDSS